MTTPLMRCGRAATLMATGLITFTLNGGGQERLSGQVAVPAFPGAQGAGAETPGGRGGRILEVTTLADSGAGSLRQAVDTPGPRIVVFRVAGTIELLRPLRIRHPYITIAGQSAPGGGITLKGSRQGGGKMIVLQDVHDVVIRFLRVRSGKHGEPGRGQINLLVDSGSHHVVVDHSSFSWTLDENVSIHRNIPSDVRDQTRWPEIHDITVQRSVMAEGLSPHSTGLQIGGEAAIDGWRGVRRITIHHNLFANNSHRNPGLGALDVKVINNVVYNWLPRAAESWRDMNVDWLANYFKAGPMSRARSILVHNSFPKQQPFRRWPAASIYMAGNVAAPHFMDPRADNFAMYREHYSDAPLPAAYRRATPLRPDPIPVVADSAAAAYESVLADVGASRRLDCEGRWALNADSVDTRIIVEVKSGTGPRTSPPEDEADVGGYARIPSGSPCADRDRDGMPDAWETAVKLNPALDDSRGRALHRQYTNVEVFLNGMAPGGHAGKP